MDARSQLLMAANIAAVHVTKLLLDLGGEAWFSCWWGSCLVALVGEKRRDGRQIREEGMPGLG